MTRPASQGGETCWRGLGLPEPGLSQVKLAMIALLIEFGWEHKNEKKLKK